MDTDDGLKSYVEEKVEKLADKYLQRSKDATVVITAEKFRRIAEITIKADNGLFTGKEETEDARSAIDLALDKLEIQARRHKQKYKHKKKGPGQEGAFAVFRGDVAEPGEESSGPEIIRENRFVPKPMSVEDALFALEDGGDDFLVFRDSDTMGICVLYRRRDGNYGLIEPES